jgi:hypothetical protein
MGIGMLALYAALAVVALWLIAELLLQNRAPVHWRGVALGGFLLVAAGMPVRSVPVIGLGAAAFAVGQVFVTLSVKRGYQGGWSLRRADGSLPGPLAGVPLLAAATSGVAAAAVIEEQERVGEVGPIEEEAAPQAVAPTESVEDYGVYETPAEYQEQQPQLPQQQPGYGYTEQQSYEYQQYGYYEQQQYVPYEQQWQQPYDPAYQQQYAVPEQQVPQQQSYEYYQPQPDQHAQQQMQHQMQHQVPQQPQPEQHWQGWQ